MHEFKGTHIIAEFIGITKTENIDAVLSNLVQICLVTRLTLINISHHLFPDGGYTIVGLLQESHFSIHYYAGNRSSFIDIFTCGRMNPERFFDRIRDYYQPVKVSCRIIERGLPK